MIAKFFEAVFLTHLTKIVATPDPDVNDVFSPASEASREVVNLTERKNTHPPIYRQSPIFSSETKKLF